MAQPDPGNPRDPRDPNSHDDSTLGRIAALNIDDIVQGGEARQRRPLYSP